jgi:plastocyanin
MKRVNIALAVVAMSLGLAACSGGSPSSSAPPSGASTGSSAPQITIGSDSANDHGQATASGSSLAIQQQNFFFTPTVISGTAGKTLTINLSNGGTTAHNFTIDSESINVTLQPGQSKAVKVSFPASGFTEFYCSFHRTLGMAGELKVG